MEHLDAPTAIALAAGRLPPEEAARWRAHAQGCAGCRSLLVQVSDEARENTGAATLEIRNLPPAGDGPASSSETLADPHALRHAVAIGTHLGRYVVVSELGSGGMGVVYQAYDPELDRKVAVKFIRPDVAAGGTMSEGRARLLREAQALARLQHPNVVTVFDVGTFQDRVFMAMELVEGETLRQWQRSAPRPRKEILAYLVAAGRGLAAAHKAGLIHRDVKPANILIGKDGRVRVTDFGLARDAAASAGSDSDLRACSAPDEPSPSGKLLQSPLTRVGAVVGTPPYMAPEQRAGKAIDGRADEFGFCVTAWEALYGERPFQGKTDEELAKQMRERAVHEPKGAKVPAWLRKVLLRGLAPTPEERYPAMEALLDALSHDPVAAWRRNGAWAAAALAVVSAASAWRAQVKAKGALCAGAERQLVGVWDAPRRAAVEKAFAATGQSFAADSFKVTATVLDQWASQWTAMRTESCEACRLRREQSDEVYALRTECLDRGLAELRALAEVLASADAKVVEKAAEAALRLPAVSGCADVAALRARATKAADPAKQAGVEAARRLVVAAHAQWEAGRYAQGLPIAEKAVQAAQATGYLPVVGEAKEMLGRLHLARGEDEQAAAAFADAVYAAESSHDDLTEANAAARLVGAAGYRADRKPGDVDWERFARAAIARLGPGAGDLPALLDNGLGVIYLDRGLYADAQAAFERVVKVREKELGPDHPDTLNALSNLSVALDKEGEGKRSNEIDRRVLAARERVLGPEHPSTAISLQNLGLGLVETGDYDEGIADLKKALALYEKHFGPWSMRTAYPLDNLGYAYQKLKNYPEAERYKMRSLEVSERSLGPDHPGTGFEFASLAAVWQAEHKYGQAMVDFRRALAIFEKNEGPDHPDVADALTGIGQTSLAEHQAGPALPLLERALAIREAAPGDDARLAETRFAVAQALWDTGRDRRRAVALAREAQKAYRALGKSSEDELKEVDGWLATRAKR